jgi:hypothetical protein
MKCPIKDCNGYGNFEEGHTIKGDDAYICEDCEALFYVSDIDKELDRKTIKWYLLVISIELLFAYLLFSIFTL